MRRKIKILFRILLVLAITGLCIMAGIKTRQKKGIDITAFINYPDNSQVGYLFKSETERFVMIDGGSANESEFALDRIKKLGGVVEVWFITVPHLASAQVILDALKDDQIQVGGIYLSVNTREWYEKNENPAELSFINEFLDTLESEGIRDRVHYLNAKDEITIDNLNFKVLKVAHPEYTQNAGNNQSLVLRISNNFKSIVFLSKLGTEYQQEFLDDNQDEIKADDIESIENRVENLLKGYGNAIMTKIW